MSASPVVFGSAEAGAVYQDRRAAYAVVIDSRGRFAAVAGRQKFFLPGGGAFSGERPEDTVIREVQEELSRDVLLVNRIGEATQYFYSDSDLRHYKMQAVFFAADFTGEPVDGGEYELHWLPVVDAQVALFHASHAWAVCHCSTPNFSRE